MTAQQTSTSKEPAKMPGARDESSQSSLGYRTSDHGNQVY